MESVIANRLDSSAIISLTDSSSMHAHVYMRAITPNPQSRRKGKGSDNEEANKGQVGPSLLRCAVDNTVVFYCNGGRQLAAALRKT